MHHCLRHQEEPAAAECRTCRGTFCNRCLVFAFGPKKPPYCVGCALHASGIRTGSRRIAPPSPFEFDVAIEAQEAATAPAEDRRGPWAGRRAKKEAARAARRAAQQPATLGSDAQAPILLDQPLASGPAPSELQMAGPVSAGTFHDL